MLFYKYDGYWDFNVEVDVQVKILKFREKFDNFWYYLMTLNNHLLVNLDANISLSPMTHVAWSKRHDLHHMDEEIFKTFLKLESASWLGMECPICKRTLGWDIYSLKIHPTHHLVLQGQVAQSKCTYYRA